VGDLKRNGTEFGDTPGPQNG